MLLDYVHQSTDWRFRLGKVHLIPRLLELILDDINTNGWEEAVTRRPVLEIATRVVRLS